MAKDRDCFIGSGNVFKDLGFEKPEEELAKAELALRINKIIESRSLTQKQAAEILGVDQPKVSALKNGRLGGFSISRLFSFLLALDRDIDIVIRSKNDVRPHITVELAEAV